MRPISESFKVIIDKQNQLGYHMPQILRRPAQKTDLKIEEDKLGLKFNTELIDLYSFSDGVEE